MSGLINWSTDPTSNDVSDPPILWQEGQPAPTVNNSARGMMAALAKWRDDNAGSLVASRGGNDAYSVATSQVFSGVSSAAAHTLAFTVSAENQGPATLSLDNLAPLPLRRAGNLELAPRDLRLGIVYQVVRSVALGAYLIVAPAFGECGLISPFGMPEPPAGWLPCDGRAVSRTSYAALFARIGGTWGTGDGSTTFNLPDFRGRTLFGADAGASRLTGLYGLGSGFSAVGGTEFVTLSIAQIPQHDHSGSTGGAGAHDHGGTVTTAGQHDHGGATGTAGGHTHGGSTVTAGVHDHTGTTVAAGNHAHAVGYTVGTAGSGRDNRIVSDIQPTGIPNAGGAVDPVNAHTHDFTTTRNGDHSHEVTIAAVGDHSHAIGSDGQHGHGIPVQAGHVHSVTIEPAGGGTAHTNLPPGAIIIWAIKA